MLPTVAEMTGISHHDQLLSIGREGDVSQTPCPGWPGTKILSISSSQVIPEPT
jgi:hypothetical protein